MRSRRSRSRSRSRSGTPSRERYRSRSRSPRLRAVELPADAKPITEADYFLKMDEFRLWLHEEKRKHVIYGLKYFNELPGDKARSYFRKFVKAWNKGRLSKQYYKGIESSNTTHTAYKWSFTGKSSRVDDEALRRAREEVNSATHLRRGDPTRSYDEPSTSTAVSSSGRVRGPTLPTPADLVHARELEEEYQEGERKYKRKRDKMEAKERVEDMVGPKEVGKEGMLEKKRAKREQDKAFREKGDEGLEADEPTLMGVGDSFRDAIARRDAARRRFESKTEDKEMAKRERTNALREKEKATMDMFQQLAKQRFG